MPKIRVLSESLVNKIAAGEVIERPASVVKELVENALDAQAGRIHIDMKAGGRQSISVADDGSGMSREDVELSVERHATSKMSSPSDLQHISTLGFRGEALASIGAVSRMTIETRPAEDGEPTRLVVEGGIRRELGPVARAVGTTVSVRSLFYNTPARRKFLRQNDTEVRYTTQAVAQLAAAHPQVAFKLVHQDRPALELASGARVERAGELLGLDPDELLSGASEQEGVRVETLVCPPPRCARSRGKQFVIVSGRPIFSLALNRAVYSGYGGLLSHNRHPSFVLWLELDPRQVDVNVHPTKREIRFAEERRVCEVVQMAVRQSLDGIQNVGFAYAESGDGVPGTGTREFAPSFALGEAQRVGEAPGAEQSLGQLSLSLVAPSVPAPPALGEVGGEAEREAVLAEMATAAPVWQAHNKYIFAPIRDAILIIDQHVAHERIRFEEALDHFEAAGATSQELLFPLTVQLNAVEMQMVKEAQTLFAGLGFGVREFGPSTILVESVPSELTNWGDGSVFQRILSELLEEREVRNDLQEAMAASYACHTSIRAGERLSTEEIRSVVERLFRTREPFVCPHGRPIMAKLPLSDLDRLFERT